MKFLNAISLLLSFAVLAAGCSTSNETLKIQKDDGRPLPIRLTESMAVDTATYVREDSINASVAEQASHEFGGVTEITPMLVSGVVALWPSAASNRDTAKVFLKCLVDTTGQVEMATVVRSSDSRFNEASLRAAIQSRYKWPPHTSIGPVWIMVPYTFQGQ